MKRRMREVSFVLIFLSSALFVCCGDKFDRVDTISGFTTVNIGTPTAVAQMDLMSDFKNPGVFFDDEPGLFAIPAAGTMITAKKASTPSYIEGKMFTPGSSVSMTLSNDNNYQFGAVGYPSANLGGTPLCQEVGGISLIGTPISVGITPTTGGCSAPPFGTSVAPQALTVAFCNSSVLGATAPGDVCTTFTSAAVTSIGSIKIEMKDNGMMGPEVCLVVGVSGISTATGAPIIPYSLVGFGIQIYSAAGCSALDYITTRPMPSGLSMASDGFAKFVGNGTAARLFIQYP